MAERKLTERQKKFVDAYIKTGNASEAARQAGYSPKNADVNSSRLLVNPSISAEVKRRLAELKTERTADLQETLEYLSAVMRGQGVDTVVVNGECVEIPASTRDRLKAAEMLLKVHGAFRNEVHVTSAIPIVISGGDELED